MSLKELRSIKKQGIDAKHITFAHGAKYEWQDHPALFGSYTARGHKYGRYDRTQLSKTLGTDIHKIKKCSID